MQRQLLGDEQYISAPSEGGFDPIDVVALVPEIEEENTRQNEAMDVRIGSLKENDIRRIDIAKQPNGLQELAAFSKTLTESLVEIQEKKTKAGIQRGLMLAYENGVAKETQDAFTETEAEHLAVARETEQAAQEVERQTGDRGLADRVRSMSDAERYGYTKGMIQMGAADYPIFLQENKDKISVVVNGRPVTLETAKTEEEFAAVQAEITSTFLSQYQGLNPALLNKYLFPNIRQINNTEAIEFATRLANEREAERTTQRQNQLIIGSKAGEANLGSNYVLNHPEGPRKGKQELAALLQTSLENGTLTGDQVRAIINEEITFADGSVSSLLGKDPSIFGGLIKAAEDADAKRLDRDTRRLEDEKQAWTNNAVETLRSISARGGTPTVDDIRALRDEWEENFPDSPFPEKLAGIVTAEMGDLRAQRERLNDIINHGRGFLIETDFDGISEGVRREFEDELNAGKAVTELSATDSRTVDDFIRTAAEEVGLYDTGKKEFTLEGKTQALHARRDFEAQYAANLVAGMSQQEAFDSALKSVTEKVLAKKYDDELTQTQPSIRIQEAKKELLENKELLTTKVFLTKEELKEALKAYETSGRKAYPPAVRAIASSLGQDPWVVAQAQLNAAGMLNETGEDQKPDVVKDVEKLSPEIQDFLLRNPSPSRTNRAVIESQTTGDTKWFLDTVASKESSAHGEYDAMNMGGSGIGPNNQAYGSANSCDKSHGCLSSMTLGQVMALQANGDAFAVGRYQFIPATLKETVEQMGISYDTPFDATLQDALAIGRLRWRLSVQNSALGLRNEWQGLWHLPDTTVAELLEAGREIVSPYDSPKNILPALRS